MLQRAPPAGTASFEVSPRRAFEYLGDEISRETKMSPGMQLVGAQRALMAVETGCRRLATHTHSRMHMQRVGCICA